MNAPHATTVRNRLRKAAAGDFPGSYAGAFAAVAGRLRAEACRDETPAAGTLPSTLKDLAERLALSPFEQWVVVLCAGAALDPSVREALGGASPTFARAFATLPEPHWSAVTPAGPLRAFRVLEPAAAGSADALMHAPLALDERILHHLLGLTPLDARLRPYLRHLPGAPDLPAPLPADAAKLALVLEHAPAAVQLEAEDPRDAQALAQAVAVRLGADLWKLAADDLPASAAERESIAVLWQRETLLADRLLYVDAAGSAAATALAARCHRVIIAGAGRLPGALRAVVRYAVGKPDALAQRDFWRRTLENAHAPGPAIEAVLAATTGQFHLGASALAEVGARARRDVAAGADPGTALWRACRDSARPRLADLATEIEPRAAWDQLVLPERALATLELIAANVRHRFRVQHGMGFAARSTRGLGIGALFFGESGTGKTMAAEVLAGELDLPLFRIDLSAVVSKYIGETEKNLSAVFDAAEGGGAVLLFDEADALFGKRSEVRDSHDRYANIEVSYLLQRMESYRGLAVLTTNLRAALDPAFTRRIRYVVEFPFPAPAERARLWRNAFPPEAPVGDFDPQRLAALNLTGGSIASVAMNAAFLAAADDAPVNMEHVYRAAEVEYAKLDKPLTPAEKGDYR